MHLPARMVVAHPLGPKPDAEEMDREAHRKCAPVTEAKPQPSPAGVFHFKAPPCTA